MVVLVLHTPIFLVSGFGAVTNNEYAKSISRGEVWQRMGKHFSLTVDFLFSVPVLVFLALIWNYVNSFIFEKVKKGITSNL